MINKIFFFENCPHFNNLLLNNKYNTLFFDNLSVVHEVYGMEQRCEFIFKPFYSYKVCKNQRKSATLVQREFTRGEANVILTINELSSITKHE